MSAIVSPEDVAATGPEKEKKDPLLKRIGGRDVLRGVVDDFYFCLLRDEKLQKFFVGANMKVLKWHQYNFFNIAFTELPEGMDIFGILQEKHARLYLMGLNEEHFDIFMEHFKAALEVRGIGQAEIDEAVATVMPLRAAFVENGKDYKIKQDNRIRAVKVASGIAVIGTLAVLLLRKRK